MRWREAVSAGGLSVAGVSCIAAFLLIAGCAVSQTQPPRPAGKPSWDLGRYRPMAKMDDTLFDSWLARWENNIVNDSRNRYCDKANGEDIGWLMTPFMDGFYYGYLATKNTKWIDMEFDWADAWITRAVKEPDGYVGWPKQGAAGTQVDNLDSFTADSLLGEAMCLRPLVLLSAHVLATASLKEKYGKKAQEYLALAERIYEKWDSRGSWRETADGGMITIVLPFGIDPATGGWTAGYAQRFAQDKGFSHPNNKANHVARWLLALSDATGKKVYRQRAEKWFILMKSRMKKNEDGTYAIWNYWQPAGPWDYKVDGSPKHWVGVHPNAGYYQIDTEGIVDAYLHELVFTKDDINALIATALATKRYWSALVPFSADIQKEVEAHMKPDSWGGLSGAARYLALQAELRGN